jgi:hypothetical protein
MSLPHSTPILRSYNRKAFGARTIENIIEPVSFFYFVKGDFSPLVRVWEVKEGVNISDIGNPARPTGAEILHELAERYHAHPFLNLTPG